MIGLCSVFRSRVSVCFDRPGQVSISLDFLDQILVFFNFLE